MWMKLKAVNFWAPRRW